jgi:hypothetical protein
VVGRHGLALERGPSALRLERRPARFDDRLPTAATVAAAGEKNANDRAEQLEHLRREIEIDDDAASDEGEP